MKYKASNLVINHQVKASEQLTIYGELIVSWDFIIIRSSDTKVFIPVSPYKLLAYSRLEYTYNPEFCLHSTPPFPVLLSNIVFVETLPFLSGLRKCEIQIAL